MLELYPQMHFKLDPGPEWDDTTIDRLSELGVVDTADFKGVYRGDFGQPPNPSLYTRIAEAFPAAWLEDPGLDVETDEVLRPHRSASRGMRPSTRSTTFSRWRFRRAA